MNLNHLYTKDFPQQHKVQEVDVIALYQQKDWKALNDVVICRDSEGLITATFGQSTWNCLPFSRSKTKHSFGFSEYDDANELQMELKLLVYGWLFNKSPKVRKAPKISTVLDRLSNAKAIYSFLHNTSQSTLAALSDSKYWSDFITTLVNQNPSQSLYTHIFGTINHAVKLEPWLQVSFGIKSIASTTLARELNNIESQQTLVIPQRLSDIIYGQAIKLIEEALPYKQLIADIEANLQINYLEGKEILDAKINDGSRYTCTDSAGNITNRHKYSISIGYNQPQNPKDIISPLSNKINCATIKSAKDFQGYLGHLITACYIVCGGFSGMRESELSKLTPTSYYRDTFEGRDFHMLQSHTFKLGERKETWVTAPIAEQAIALATALTQNWRKNVDYPDKKHANTLWCNQLHRSKPPVIITKWNQKLQQFCQHFNFVVTEEDYQECIDCNHRSLERIKKSVTVGAPWPMSTHQFRRTLAFYCIKNRLGTLVALKQQFKHLYLAMTEWYTNGGRLMSLRNLKADTNIQQELERFNTETIANKIFKQWHSDEKLSGTYGKSIVQMRGDTPHIYSSWEVIYHAVKKGQLTLHSTAHSYCKNGYQCDMDGIAMPQFCVNCHSGSSIIDEKQAKWWQKKHSSLICYMAIGDDISVTDKAHYITQIRAAENVMTDFDMVFTPFEAELKVMEL